ncbi:hypothetical protein LTR78_007893 [Recurvomyces mirabilis]|uniref:Uncharacterized protein n=1 Tax=Recurvomyces mirabilis TaxID=574656 RepID=A0AAE0TTP9_9PEZI|nr:hypothetical protein LTR78_007893 [Recurvomyces mirabilis]KAK5152428.1 hypothetical protein LTS14_008375 [Recurvomyces mirabilis]
MAKGYLAILCASLGIASQVAAQTGVTATLTTAPFTNSTSPTPTITSSGGTATAPDVYLHVPTLSVKRIELDVDNLQAQLNLNANVAQLVQINAGVQVGITKVNLTIADVDAKVDLIVRLGHLVDIVGRVFQSLDLNPLLINTLGNVTSLVDGVVGDVVGVVDGLLGSITQGGTTLNFLVDNLGNIVQSVNGVSTIVGSFEQNMTATGATKTLGQGLTQKTYSYSPLSALVDIVFNTAGQIVQATVQKATGSSSSGSASSASGTVSATASAASSSST